MCALPAPAKNISHFTDSFSRYPTAPQYFSYALYLPSNKNSSTLPAINIYIPASTNRVNSAAYFQRSLRPNLDIPGRALLATQTLSDK